MAGRMNAPLSRTLAVTASMDQLFAAARDSRKELTDPDTARLARIAEFFAADIAAQFADGGRKTAGEAVMMVAQFTGSAFAANPDIPLEALMCIFALAAEQVVREASTP
jgi:hypothetical protein